ncbi:LCP family protein [Paenibacillus wulumuqiensis]|uniref:LCP family protein n=1 Tax=Paenibacillus wulumuqiensis TaxID=1567107 RepID=UPI00061908EE|nr:LCP family protein [Paenibacillus wulumuqiensis]
MLYKVLRQWKWILLLLLLAGAGVVGYYTYSVVQFANTISVEPDDPAGADQQETNFQLPEWDGKDPVHILLLGTDSRDDGSNGRSDSMMVATIDPVSKKAYLMSILRDTYVEIPGHGRSRINAAYSYGGAPLAMQTVSQLLGVPVNSYVTIDFEGFKALVDEMDGVDIDVEKDMYYTDGGDGHRYDIDLKKGYQTLDGTHALQYVRFRHDATSDFTRTERQRKFLTALAAKMQSSTSIVNLPGILKATAPYIKTNMSASTMLKLAGLGMDVNVSKTEKLQIPPTPLLREEVVHGAAVLGVDENELRKYIQDKLSETDDQLENDKQAGDEQTDEQASKQ